LAGFRKLVSRSIDIPEQVTYAVFFSSIREAIESCVNMKKLKSIFEKNHSWASKLKATDPDFFSKSVEGQAPTYLYIGCADSRVSADQLLGLMPGEVFVHRNVANLVVHTDFNCLSVLEYAITVLKIKHVIVCGHYGCGGIRAALGNSQHGLIDNWLRNIKDIANKHQALLDKISDENDRLNKLCELNVIEQVKNICHTTIVQQCWSGGAELSVHGWIYDIGDGLLKDLNVCVSSIEDISETYRVLIASELSN
jgi:carbonic anhydrase